MDTLPLHRYMLNGVQFHTDIQKSMFLCWLVAVTHNCGAIRTESY
jgi:hypothetical protein